MLFAIIVLVVLMQLAQSCDLDDPQLISWARQRIKILGNCTALSAGFGHVPYKVPNVKVFVYHNDEHEVIADFLQYHSYVFGFRNIVVIDQNSQMESICKTLALFQRCGTEVITVTSSFQKKGQTLTDVMLKYKNTLLIPLDSDEFIFPFPPEKPSLNRDELWKAIKALPVDGRKYKFELHSAAMPNVSACTRSFATEDDEYRRVVDNELFFVQSVTTPRTKTFFHSHGFINTDDGNHYGSVVHDKGVDNVHPAIAKNMSHYFAVLQAQMVHYPMGGYRCAKDKYVRAAREMGYTSDTNCSTPGRVGGQYCKPSKLFINGSDHGAQFYMNMCHTPSHAYPVPDVNGLFREHTLSMWQLTGLKLV